MDEVSARAGGVFEKMVELMPELGEAQRLAEEKQRQAEIGDGRPLAPSSEKKQESVKRQERVRQRQKKQAEKRDQEMDL